MYKGMFVAFTLSDGSISFCVPVWSPWGTRARLPADHGDLLGQRPAQKAPFSLIGENSLTGCAVKFRHGVKNK